MKVLIVSLFIVGSVFASEKEGVSACDSYNQRVDRIQKEMTKVSYEIAQAHSGPEDSGHSSPSSSGSFNCEEGGDAHQALIARRDKLEAELKEVRREQRRACGRVYPE